MDMELLKVRRKNVLDKMEKGTVAILYSGKEVHISEDAYFDFEVNKHFRYLTDIARDNMILFLDKTGEEDRVILFIEEADVTMEKWFGKKLTIDEAKEISGIDKVFYLDRFEGTLLRMIQSSYVKGAYFDTYRYSMEDAPDFNAKKALEFREKFPTIPVLDLHSIVSYFRMAKDTEEVTRIRAAVDATRQGLEEVMKNLKPGMYEYQAQALYEGKINYLGTEGPSFPTIAGSGYNGTMLHYETNRMECKDGELLLLDLGSRVNGWCSDITRTYPINGKYTDRQKDVYNVVLKANKKVAEEAKPGVTLRELNEICTKVLTEGCKELGLIKEDSEISKYYMHGVSHHLGLDVHDVSHVDGIKLRPGCVITNEPGLYIEEECIGIRIEDDLLITEDGCEVLSKDIIKEPEEIEAFMANK